MGTWWLEADDGSARQVGTQTLSLGRASSCDIVLDSESASRLHAVVALVSGAPVIVPLGRTGVRVDEKPIDSPTPLRGNQQISLPGLSLRVVGWDDPSPDWMVQHGELALRVPGVLTIGGGHRDGLRIQGLSDAAVQLTTIGEELVVEVGETAQIDGAVLEPGELSHAKAEQHLSVGAHTFKVFKQLSADTPTQIAAYQSLPLKAVFRFETTGGRLGVTIGSETTELQLSELRARLIASLLSPPRGFEAGESLPDDNLVGMIWPGESRGRLDINQLVHRTRKDLLAAGLDGLRLIQRAGGGTAFLLAPGAQVDVA